MEARRDLDRIMQQDVPFEEKTHQALALGRETLGVENVHLTRIEPESNYWKSILSTDPPDGRFPDGVILDLEETMCNRTIEEGVLVQDSDDLRGAGHDGLGAYLGVAISGRETPVGTVCFVSEEDHDEVFAPIDVMFAELIARRIEFELLREETTEKLNRLDQFARTISHDLRNPLSVAMGRLTLATRECESEHLHTVDRSLRRMQSMIEEVLAWARQTQELGRIEEVSLHDLVETAWATVDTAEAELQLDEDLIFEADRERALRLFENLIRNAVEHGGEGVSIRIGATDPDGCYIEDDGSGIPAADRDRVLEAGYSTLMNGTGIGLSIVASIADTHGWSLDITEGREGGARFEISELVVDSSQA